MRISDWSSDVCSSDLRRNVTAQFHNPSFACQSLQNFEVAAIDDEHLAGDEAGAVGAEKGGGRRHVLWRSHARDRVMARPLGDMLIIRLAAFGRDLREDRLELRRRNRAGTARIDGDPHRSDFGRSEAPTPGLQSLMRHSYAVYCLE